MSEQTTAPAPTGGQQGQQAGGDDHAELRRKVKEANHLSETNRLSKSGKSRRRS